MSIKSAGLYRAETTSTISARFKQKCGRSDGNGCIPWIGQITRNGYGVMRIGGAGSLRTTAHRVAWLLERGDLSPEILVLHRCDNPSCVNIDHLFIGSQQDNVNDMVSKNRHQWREMRPWQKLNFADDERIIDIRRAGKTHLEIADYFEVSRPLISLILAGNLQHTTA
jgi:hypothetical protein